MSSSIDTGDTAWVIASTALVLLMTPGLAFFYSGMARAKNVLNTLMMSYICMGIITMVWFVIGYSLAFAPGGWFIGDASFLFLDGVGADPDVVYAATIPALVFCAFQLMFAIITPALISGAMVERFKFSTYVIFTVAWSLIVYSPVAHWVWSAWENSDGTMEYGWLRKKGALDFAGGTVVHIISGVSGLVASFFIGPRKGYPIEPTKAHNIPFTILGVGLLWFGWFGFNGGSALGANGLAAYAMFNTQLAAGASMTTWVLIEFFVSRPSIAGAGTAAIVGLVVITPACGFVKPFAAVICGVIGAIVCFIALWGKHWFINRIRRAEKKQEKPSKCNTCITWADDSLDAFGCHGLGGALGAILTGFFATTQVNPAGFNGVFYGNSHQLWVQLLAVIATVGWAIVLTSAILIVLKYTIGLRATEMDEDIGMDVSQHREEGYLGLFKITGEDLFSLMGSVENSLKGGDDNEDSNADDVGNVDYNNVHMKKKDDNLQDVEIQPMRPLDA